jgi:hypothetical protein
MYSYNCDEGPYQGQIDEMHVSLSHCYSSDTASRIQFPVTLAACFRAQPPG